MKEKHEFRVNLPFAAKDGGTALRFQGDKVIWMITLFLSIISTLAVYSAISFLAYKNGSPVTILLKHVFFLCIGLGIMYLVHRVNYKYFSRLSQLLIWVAAGLLLYTLFFGANINQADRWIRIPFLGLTFQTSDFAKIVLITYVARVLTQKRESLGDFRGSIVPVLIPIGVICGLILPANFSTAFMLALVCVVMMFMAGVPWRHMAKLAGVGVGLIAVIILVGETMPGLFPRYDTWKNRIFNHAGDDADGNYQPDIAKAAIYHGGVIPNGPGTGTSRNNMPQAYSDMIYAFIIEEYGSIIGGIGVLGLYLILFYRSVRIASRSPKHFGALLALGISLLIVAQAFINMAVAVSLFPTTGQPLPLISMGGTSTIFTCISIGMVLSVARSINEGEEVEVTESEDAVLA